MAYIETERLIIREYKLSDIDDVYEYASDEDVFKYMITEKTTRKNDIANALKKMMKLKKQTPRKSYELAIVIKQNNKLIGGGEFTIKSRNHRKAEIGYILNKKYWGCGYATETAKALLYFGFFGLNMHRISASCDVLNAPSIRLLEKIGMKQEGRLEENFFVKNRWRNSYLYAILEHNFDMNETIVLNMNVN